MKTTLIAIAVFGLVLVMELAVASMPGCAAPSSETPAKHDDKKLDDSFSPVKGWLTTFNVLGWAALIAAAVCLGYPALSWLSTGLFTGSFATLGVSFLGLVATSHLLAIEIGACVLIAAGIAYELYVNWAKLFPAKLKTA